MELPPSLPAQLFLLAYDPSRQRIVGIPGLGVLLRAGALEELRLLGALRDADGLVTPQDPTAPVTDPWLAEVLRDIVDTPRPRRWKWWIARHDTRAYRAVRDRLETAGIIRPERARILGIFPVARIYVNDEAMVEALRQRFERLLLGGSLDAREAALVALAAAGQLGTVLPRRARRQYRDRITQLTTGPVPAALRRVIQERAAAAAG
jgi:hypothetical protein